MVTIFFLYCGGKAAATESERLTMESANSNNQRLTCHKHGQTPSLEIAVEGQVRAHYCLVCFEEMLVRQGVHAMFPVVAQTAESESEELFPEELEIS